MVTPSMSDPRLQTAWAVRAAAGEPFAVVRVKNLQTVVCVSRDAWGRPNNSGQPLLISAEVSFARPFDTAASEDRLGTDTVHYGNLSKVILAAIDWHRPVKLAGPGPVLVDGPDNRTTLGQIISKIWVELTSADHSSGKEAKIVDARPFLAPGSVRFLSVTLHLPKASLLGDGVSLAASTLFDIRESKYGVKCFSRTLCIRNLRVPTLIGVNAFERQAKQFVFATVEIDQFDRDEDVYTDLETLIVREMEASSFETLEALGAHLAHAIRTVDWLPVDGGPSSAPSQWQIRVSLEKPSAVPLADSPVVELVTGPQVPAFD
ncbi:hypothetical protein GQ53DRAFT_879876 [Thozetella sp. PMI_491]|nr:hypothetical protein GQ53DRAFT_879876 [Thozetella sp. PMI_491]